MKYYYHPESDCLFSVSDDENYIPIDPFCEEIDQEMYFELLIKQKTNLRPIEDTYFGDKI